MVCGVGSFHCAEQRIIQGRGRLVGIKKDLVHLIMSDEIMYAL